MHKVQIVQSLPETLSEGELAARHAILRESLACWARICKRLRSLGIDAKELISPEIDSWLLKRFTNSGSGNFSETQRNSLASRVVYYCVFPLVDWGIAKSIYAKKCLFCFNIVLCILANLGQTTAYYTYLLYIITVPYINIAFLMTCNLGEFPCTQYIHKLYLRSIFAAYSFIICMCIFTTILKRYIFFFRVMQAYLMMKLWLEYIPTKVSSIGEVSLFCLFYDNYPISRVFSPIPDRSNIGLIATISCLTTKMGGSLLCSAKR